MILLALAKIRDHEQEEVQEDNDEKRSGDGAMSERARMWLFAAGAAGLAALLAWACRGCPRSAISMAPMRC